MSVIDFLQTKTSKEELSSALKVLREFKKCESEEEWMRTLFIAWIKLEQLEEYLAHLVEGAPLNEDTTKYLEGKGPSNE
jgi:hypothetical protein